MTPSLTNNFEAAAAICADETKGLSDYLRTYLLDSSACAVPEWDPASWRFNDPHNCYNFAVNNKDVPIAFPGMLAPQPFKPAPYYFDTNTMHKDLHNGALKDGLIYLGGHFLEAASTRQIAPVALFMREPPYIDFHWMALRRHQGALFWAHVPGAKASAMLLRGGISIFTSASERGYHKFGGYYGMSGKSLVNGPL